jgi:HSP20 family molecular chaperone IbpA
MTVPDKKDQLGRLQGEIQELIDELWQVPRFSGLRRGFRPPVDVVRVEDPAGFRVVVELPGVDPENVQVYADAQTLVVAGERRRACQGRYFHMEIDHGPFQRRVEFAEQVDPSRARAEYRRGMLTISLPLAEREPVEKRVAIKVGANR